MLLCLLLAAAEPSVPPLVPTEPAAAEPGRAAPAPAPVAEEPPAPPSGRRFLGTALGALIGDTLAVGLWSLQLVIFGGACGSGCLPVGAIVTGAGTLLGIAPIGAYIGNHAAGGATPYWKPFVGTAAGATLAALTIAAFEVIGFLRGPSNEPAIGVAIAMSAALVMMGQIVTSELGAD